MAKWLPSDPAFEAHNKIGWVTGFFRPGENESVIDVTMPYRRDNEESLKTAVWVEEEGMKYRVPTLEASLAGKYGAMRSVEREVGTRVLDTVDFSWMVKHARDPHQTPIDIPKLRALGEMVWPGGGGKELIGLVQKVNDGGIPNIEELHPGEPGA